MEGLPNEFGTGPAPVNPHGVAAGFRNWGNAGVGGQTLCGGEAITLGSDGGDEARFQSRSGAREGLNNGPIGMRTENLGNVLFHGADASSHLGQEPDRVLNTEHSGFQQGRIVGGGDSLANLLQALLIALFATAVVLVEEVEQGLGGNLL